MKKTATIIILVVAFVGGFLFFYRDRTPPSSPQTNTATSDTSQKWETKTDDQASVTVVVTPTDLSPNSKEWKFDVGMNTHSVELDQDMTKIAVLVDDQGKEYGPIKWDGPTGGGHHREGVLSFIPITPYPQHLTLKVKDIGGVERVFSWTLIEE